eukprot:TRINITY_DN6258_c0_g1_i2.p1 TRINITY_DN6258_c0_g1~~TRINITY_DN6258_c0_g1_i2.p1  ORF type:complete len:298 (+),score=37.93 TRINITY_DN6258_c0_g1_i2:80-973(+)
MGAAETLYNYRSVIAGASGGFVNSIVCAPLDVAKVRQQVAGITHVKPIGSVGLTEVLKTIYREEGWRGLFRGIQPSLVTLPLFWACYFPIYDGIKRQLGVADRQHAAAWKHCVAAMGAAAVCDVLTNPLWVVRTRMISAVYHESERTALQKMSVRQHVSHIVRKEGIWALYKGLGASLIGLAHVALQFPMYEVFKEKARAHSPDGKEGLAGLMAASAGSKLIAGTITYPHEVIRARMQDARTSSSLIGITRQIWREEGPRGFFRGLRVNVVRVLPSCVTTFVTYELVKQLLERLHER